MLTVYFERSHFDSARSEVLFDRVVRVGSLHQRARYLSARATQELHDLRYAFSADVLARAQEAEAIAATLGDHALHTDTRYTLAFHLSLDPSPSSNQRAAAMFQRVVEDAEATSQSIIAARALAYWLLATRRLGKRDDCRALIPRVRHVAERTQYPPYVAMALGCQVWLDLDEKSPEALEAVIAQARALGAKTGHVYPFTWSYELTELVLAGDDFDRIRRMAAALIAPMQQALDMPLDQALRALVATTDTRSLAARVKDALHAAVACGYL